MRAADQLIFDDGDIVDEEAALEPTLVGHAAFGTDLKTLDELLSGGAESADASRLLPPHHPEVLHATGSSVSASGVTTQTKLLSAPVPKRKVERVRDLSPGQVNADVGRQRGRSGTLIQQRLIAAAILVCVGLLAYFIRSLVVQSSPYPYLRAIVLLNSITCLCILLKNRMLPLDRLRFLELLLFIPPAIQIVLTQLLQMREAGVLQNSVLLSDLLHNGTLGLIIVMMSYAMLIPNGWKRAAVLLSPLALAPLATIAYLRMTIPWTQEVLTLQVCLELATTLAVSLFASIWGTFTISALRQEVSRARQLGQYRLARRLGAGGMGQVFLAEHRLLTRPCAVKLIHPQYGTDPIALMRFEQEVRSMAQLSHWNTVEIYDYGHTEDGTFYYVMEYLPGMNLGELVARFGPLSPERTVHFLIQTCRALHEAHQLGMIHRDLKPANVYAAKRGGEYDVAKLLDFGLVLDSRGVRVRGYSDSSRQTSVAGSPLFMSPEQATYESVPDARSDIYALGATAYFLLTGRPPFEGKTPVQVMIKHARDRVVPLRDLRADIPADVEAIVLRCLAKNQELRFGSARELELALCRCSVSGKWNSDQAERWWQTFAPEIDLPVEI
ncbi:Serine/threonine protein kinase-related protein [Planctopirus limnophila DSM 3776]|uniref:Serine/threonine protein kinase-related protein n=1 Tax=Planctopirus limnophila (strain ATCC 43296 / DSM 3776 / IFAM 1008 / Mu 290) TaxID=521674 RepID=D5SMV7_PLAL2|nr:serine/threonine-protein kinase [Planctopirus limnophila]ADG68012.1 Serine/threonine protein kinase-related protein [Planctopirus limnophila DSM 3776]